MMRAFVRHRPMRSDVISSSPIDLSLQIIRITIQNTPSVLSIREENRKKVRKKRQISKPSAQTRHQLIAD
uniref:Uncharacterized protein n=1 Tax=Caenorhabditis tropicalis TaxID=1561998 RepID=A0A1I7UQX9_9PELO